MTTTGTPAPPRSPGSPGSPSNPSGPDPATEHTAHHAADHAPQRPAAHEPGLDAWLDRRRRKCPEKTALIFDETTVSYRELADAADRVSALLWHRGIRSGDRVAYMGENSPQFLQLLFGAVQLGAVFVPVNTRLAAGEIAHILGDSGARMLVHDPEFTERLATGDTTASIDALIVTGDGTADAPGLARLIAAETRPRPRVEVRMDDPAAIIYTSGTTGRAKGAVLSHANLCWSAINAVVDYDIVSTDIGLMISPLFHVASLGMGALPSILMGATIVLERGFEAGRALAQIQRHRVTMLSGVPTTFQLLADHPDWASTDLSSMQKLTCGGSAVPNRILDAFEARGLSFSQGYGMTEASPGATALPPSMTRAKKGSVGLPMFFTEVRVTDPDDDEVRAGRVGEIEVRGPNVFPGYHNLPDATASAFTPDGWYRTGDLGYLDDDGYLFISDRLRDMIISGAENIYPAEIENHLNDIPGVSGVAVIGVPDDRWGEVPAAIFTVRAGTRLDTEQVRGFLDGKLARYKLPRAVAVVDELPRTSSGKVRKAELRLRFPTLASVESAGERSAAS